MSGIVAPVLGVLAFVVDSLCYLWPRLTIASIAQRIEQLPPAHSPFYLSVFPVVVFLDLELKRGEDQQMSNSWLVPVFSSVSGKLDDHIAITSVPFQHSI
ncbi:MAG: hypothetical protein C5B60_00185 [Chloroflexi bacterium]|nr:MAG: hypothetical protein C5B60_00185 [Chloroflexota bacterium]